MAFSYSKHTFIGMPWGCHTRNGHVTTIRGVSPFVDHLLEVYPPRLTRRPHEMVLCVGGTARHVPASMQAVTIIKYAHRTQLSADRTPRMDPTHAPND